MRDLNDLFFFVQAAEHGGFAPAARNLGMPKSRLSRGIAMLEDRLGVRLFQRSTRRFAVAEIGKEYYRHCAAMLVEADAAEVVGPSSYPRYQVAICDGRVEVC
jgi:DNA-binding transcriptional LysR family regulator